MASTVKLIAKRLENIVLIGNDSTYYNVSS